MLLLNVNQRKQGMLKSFSRIRHRVFVRVENNFSELALHVI
jgi:hypothetical protein